MSRRRSSLWLCAILALTFAVHAPSLGNEFAYDDRFVVKAVRDNGTTNEMVAELQPLGAYFTTHYWHGVFEHDVLFRPVTILSYALTHAAGARGATDEAGEARPQHALNVLLQLLATWLVYRLVRGLRSSRPASLVAAAVFGLHALHSEVVAGIVGRAELLAFALGAGATLLYAAALRHAGPRGWPWLAATASLCFAALGAKESAVAWVPFLPLYAAAAAWRRDPTITWRAQVRAQWIPTAIATLVPLAAFVALRQAMIAALPPARGELFWVNLHDGSVPLTGLLTWAWGWLLVLLPVHLSFDYGPAMVTPVYGALDLRLWLVVAALGAGLWWTLRAPRRRPLLFLAGAMFFGHGFLTSNVPFQIGVVFAERLQDAPSLAASLLAAWLAGRSSARWRPLLLAALAAWLAWSAWLTVTRAAIWKNDETLYRHEALAQPRSARAAYNLAQILARGDDEAGMASELQRAVKLHPQHARAWSRLGEHHLDAGRHGEAARCLQRAMEATDAGDFDRVPTLLNLAAALARSGRAADARRWIEEGARQLTGPMAKHVADLARLAPEVGAPWLTGVVNRLAAAAPELRDDWHFQRARVPYEGRDFAVAATALQQALDAGLPAPARAEASVLLASALASSGEPARARAILAALLREPGLPEGLRDTAQSLLARLPR